MSSADAPGLVVAIFGPTGSGKTALASAIADRLPAHLVSCDSVQVYRHLRVATAKPEGEELRHPWALVDVMDPAEPLDLGAYVRAADAELREAARRGRVPLVVGGTGLYLRGLLKGVAEAPPRDAEIRERLQGLAVRRGVPFLHRVLTRLDPELAARLGPNDEKRLVRGLEVRLLAGRPLSVLQGGGWAGPDRFPVMRIGLELPRDLLYERLDRRVERFFADGLVAEVRWLLDEVGVPEDANALLGIGYREVVAWLRGRSAARSEPELVGEVQQSTRRYAKRQMTWFRRERPASWIDPREEGLAERLAREIAARAREIGEG